MFVDAIPFPGLELPIPLTFPEKIQEDEDVSPEFAGWMNASLPPSGFSWMPSEGEELASNSQAVPLIALPSQAFLSASLEGSVQPAVENLLKVPSMERPSPLIENASPMSFGFDPQGGTSPEVSSQSEAPFASPGPSSFVNRKDTLKASEGFQVETEQQNAKPWRGEKPVVGEEARPSGSIEPASYRASLFPGESSLLDELVQSGQAVLLTEVPSLPLQKEVSYPLSTHAFLDLKSSLLEREPPLPSQGVTSLISSSLSTPSENLVVSNNQPRPSVLLAKSPFELSSAPRLFSPAERGPGWDDLTTPTSNSFLRAKKVGFSSPSSSLSGADSLDSQKGFQLAEVVGALSSVEGKRSSLASSPDSNLAELSRSFQSLISRGGGQMRIFLKPENLGQLVLEVQTRGVAVDLRVEASSQEAKSLLEEGLEGLRDQLSGQALHLSSFSLDVRPLEDASSFLASDFGDRTSDRPPERESGFEDSLRDSPSQKAVGRDSIQESARLTVYPKNNFTSRQLDLVV